MKKPGFNPYLPSWEYIPDGEPYVFGDRVYVYGSHDFFNGYVFCMGDYVCWSAPVNDLTDWRYEGVIYPRNADPMNADGEMCLYAPDVTVGSDGRYYLYYVLDHLDIVSVAVCDEPAGRYQFYGYVHHADGTYLGRAQGDEPQFDPGVITEGDVTWLYTGFCPHGGKDRHGAMVTKLAADMLTVLEGPQFVVPGVEYAKGTMYEQHPFFEAPSIRKVGEKYYFVYSSVVMHELCYAVSDRPDGGFVFGGVIVSNCDLFPGRPQLPMALGGNNHGSIIEIAGQWYVFYHRQTNNTWFSRQGCAEPIAILPDGSIPQVEITSCGLNGGPLPAKGEYPAYIACHLYDAKRDRISNAPGAAYITQEGRDGDEIPGYIANLHDTVVAGFKYFDFEDVQRITLKLRGYGTGGRIHVRLSPDGENLATMELHNTNLWAEYSAPVSIPNGKQALYLAYEGGGSAMLGFICFA